jgi:hypothetical protein
LKKKRCKPEGYIIYSNFPHLENVLPIRYRKLPEHHADLIKIVSPP